MNNTTMVKTIPLKKSNDKITIEVAIFMPPVSFHLTAFVFHFIAAEE